VPFQITIYAYNKVVPGTVLDEGALVSLMPFAIWQDLGFPQLVPVTQSLLAFDGGTSQPFGILSKFPITLGGKIVYIDIMVVQGGLDFSLLLGCDYIYVMGALVSSLFCVVFFPDDGRIVTIDQLLFFGHQIPPIQPLSPIGSYLQTMSSPPQVNYVVTHFTSTSIDDHAYGLIHHVLEALEPNLSLVSNDMCSYWSVLLLSSEDLLGAIFLYSLSTRVLRIVLILCQFG